MVELSGRPILVISPHLDDAVLSCWGIVDNFSADVITVFAGTPAIPLKSPWDQKCGFENSTVAMAVRVAENQHAFEGIRNHTSVLEVCEGAYRGQLGPEHSWEARKHVFITAVDEWIASHGDSPAPPVVVLPGGGGLSMRRATGPDTPGFSQSSPVASRDTPSREKDIPLIRVLKTIKHRLYLRKKTKLSQQGLLQNGDHILVRDEGIAHLLGREDVQVVLYDELPYLWSRPADEAVSLLRWKGDKIHAEQFDVKVDTRRKFRAVSAYQSQLEQLDPASHRLEQADTYPSEERYWAISPRSTTR
jgi:hypothetical protein